MGLFVFNYKDKIKICFIVILTNLRICYRSILTDERRIMPNTMLLIYISIDMHENDEGTNLNQINIC